LKMEVLQMYDPDTGKKKPSRVRAFVRLLMRLHLRWKTFTRTSKAVLITVFVISLISAAYYTHSTFTSSKGSSDEWRRQLGRAAWHFLHTTAAQLPDKENITATHLEAFRSIFRSLEVIYPCEECREHLVQNMKRMRSLDAVVDAPSALMWTCELHNIVNEAQKKPLFPCDPEKLAKKWSNPNCGCRSKKGNDAASVPALLNLLHNPSPAAPQGHLQHSQQIQAPVSSQAKAEAILKAQAKVAADAADRSMVTPPPDVSKDSSSQRAQDANAEPAPDRVVLPDGEEAAGD
jgi:hypothetical protein